METEHSTLFAFLKAAPKNQFPFPNNSFDFNTWDFSLVPRSRVSSDTEQLFVFLTKQHRLEKMSPFLRSFGKTHVFLSYLSKQPLGGQSP